MTRRKVEREERFAPTAETKAKLQSDVVAKLHDAGNLTGEQAQAAMEIRRIHEALQRGVYGASGGMSSAGLPQDPLSRLTDTEEIIWRRHFCPWAQEVRLALVGRATVRSNLKSLTLDIVADNIGLMAAAFRHFVRPDLVLPTLRRSLTRYAEIAGWVEPLDKRPDLT